MRDVIGMIVALAVIGLGLMVGLYRLGWWRGYSAAQNEYMETLSRRDGKNWCCLMKERMQREDVNEPEN